MTPDLQNGIGGAWLALADQLEQALRRHDPRARVEATVSASGLLALDVRTTPARHAWAAALARGYETAATRTCERCGAPVAVAVAGSVLTILCADCSMR